MDLGKIFAYIISKKAFDAEYVGQYKTKKAYSYFISGFVHEVLLLTVCSGRVILKAKVTPSQKLRENPREAWILCSGDVYVAHCSCTAGFGECCNHVVAILYKIEFANTHQLIDPACTSQACAWNKCTCNEIQATINKDVEIHKHEREKTNKRRTINSP